MATASRRPYAPRLPPEQRREQLLDAALRLIVTEGYGAITIEAVAKAAGVTRPVVYGVFANLDELLAALFARCEARGLAGVAGALPTITGEGDPDEMLYQGILSFLRAVAADPDTWHVILLPVEGTPEVVRDRVAGVREGLWGQLTALVSWGAARRGGPTGLDAELAARAMIVVVEDAGRLVLSDPQRFPPERFAKGARGLLRLLPGSE